MTQPTPVAVPGNPHRVPTLQGPAQKNLAQILADLQKRVARLESKINTH